MMGAVGGGSPLLVSSYTIDQTGTYSAPNQMVRDRDATVFQMIYAASHLYVGYLDNGVLQCKQVSDTDKTLYADGTSVSYDANNDLFMKLPRFWWKCENVDGSADKMKFSFTMDDPKSASWYEWEGDTFIGAYKGYKDSANKLRSISGITPSGGVSFGNWKTYSRNKGSGYQMVTYEAHQMMALLFYGYFGTLDSQATIGYGNNTNGKTTGLANARGMGNGQTNNSINYWGLENWWGDMEEFVDNLLTANNTGTVAIYNREGSVVRYITTFADSGGYGTYFGITKMLLGTYGDLMPLAYKNSNFSQYYCDTGGVSKIANRVGNRGGSGNNQNGGISRLELVEYGNRADGFVANTVGTRLLYKGPYQIND